MHTKHRKKIFKALCKKFGKDKADVLGPRRYRELVIIRQLYAHLMNRHYGVTVKLIGEDMNRDHTTIVNNIENSLNDYDCIVGYRESYWDAVATAATIHGNNLAAMDYRLKFLEDAVDRLSGEILKLKRYEPVK